MDKTIKFLISEKDNGKRVDIFLAKKIANLTRTYIKKLIEEKKLKINKNIIISPSLKIKTNDQISLNVVKQQSNNLIPNKIKLNIVYEDNDILLINKPKGMVVHPGAGNFQSTLANALAHKYKKGLSNINGELRPGIVHRIDKETSGLLVIAKNNLAHSN